MKGRKIFLWDEVDGVNPNYDGATSLGLQTDTARPAVRRATRPYIVLVTGKSFFQPASVRYRGLTEGWVIGSC